MSLALNSVRGILAVYWPAVETDEAAFYKLMMMIVTGYH